MPYTASRGPGRPPAAKAAETRERILGAAREVFSELGYDAATFQAIAIRADLTRPAINHYFASKRVLWAEVVEQTNTSIVSAGVARAHERTGLVDRLAAFLSATTQADTEDRSAAAFLVTSVLETQRHPELVSDEHDPLKNSRAFVTWAVNDAIERGELSSDTDVSTWWRCWWPCCGDGLLRRFRRRRGGAGRGGAQTRTAAGQQALASGLVSALWRGPHLGRRGQVDR